jgi:uncharacterized protein YegL
LATVASLLAVSDASVAAPSQVRVEQSQSAFFLQTSAASSSTAMAEEFMRGKGPGMEQITKRAETMGVGEAMKHLKGKLPAELPGEVVAFVQTNDKSKLDKDSIEKANKIIRKFIVAGWKELDAEIVKCKEFEDRNRGTYDQVMTDLSRLAEQISDLERQRAEANENINTKEIEFVQVQFELRKQTMIYMRIRWGNSQDMIIRKNDLAVFLFILRFTECPTGEQVVKKKTVFAQIAEGSKHRGAHCDCPAVPMFNLADPELQVQLNKMSPKARESVSAALDGAVDTPKLSLLQTGTATATMEDPPPPPASDRAPVKDRQSLRDMAKKCPCGGGPCPKFHDRVSLLWGKYQDMVDELQAEMDRNEARFVALRTDLTTQMEIIKIAKGRYMMLLAEVISNLNADQSEQSEKEVQRQELDAQYYKFMAECRKRIEAIICYDIVAWVCIRDAIMCEHPITALTDGGAKCERKIQDCVVSFWMPDDCSVPCDDSCPTIFKTNDDPYKCGGWQTLTRRVVTSVPEVFKEFAVGCPALTTTRKCNQQKCPVNCEMSMWSGWSKCTKDCEGGVRGRTRSILTKPKNGGESCNTVQEEEACNTGSCDRDCALHPWTEWGFCTMACVMEGPAGSLGLQERVRRVDIPIRGEGKCPKEESASRLEERECNQFPCVEPVVCISEQDLIIAIDSSGSMEALGFKTIKDFVHSLIGRYKAKYYGEVAMQIGVVEFGNGQVAGDGTIASALEVIKLTNDLTKVQEKIEGMKWQGGFTNMAQALVLADSMLQSGRKKAQPAVLVVTDGKPSTVFETNAQIVKMKDRAIKLFFAPVTSDGGAHLELMKHWASQPWESHYVHVPGLYALKGSTNAFADRFIATFCPEAFNPDARVAEEKEVGFFLLKEHAICGDPTQGNRLSTNLKNVGECAALVRSAKCGADGAKKACEAFSYGEWYRRGYCYSEHFKIEEAKMKEWSGGTDRDDPTAPCDAASAGGTVPSTNQGWTYNPFYDTYVLETDTMSGSSSR